MAVMNEKGAFFIKGRKQDSIRFNIYGDLVYPGPIENIMASHPAVKEIAVSTDEVRCQGTTNRPTAA